MVPPPWWGLWVPDSGSGWGQSFPFPPIQATAGSRSLCPAAGIDDPVISNQ